ncbi:uncharacterized protein LOC141857914 [Brevipalpus obovatus]|uniref:uncharacterized protein LOC141857914 n=1 Tax=Brevipalpus obovatus TaxID=246614 RepID=UPI003D9F9C11
MIFANICVNNNIIVPLFIIIFFETIEAFKMVVNGRGNFILEETLIDGEKIVRINWDNVTALITTVSEYKLQQITDNMHILNSWYINNKLVDCEYSEDKRAMRRLISDASISHNPRRICGQSCHKINIPKLTSDLIQSYPQLQPIMNRVLLARECKKFHEKIKTRIRKNRSTDLLMFPGTNWCGKGTSSKNFRQLGPRASTDRCCRDHDHCKLTISPFERKFHFFNYRLYVISHCDCDERFRACLRLANTGSSNLVGRVFFNIVQTKCFTLKAEKVCKKRSWWGNCTKKGRVKRAHLRDGLFY